MYSSFSPLQNSNSGCNRCRNALPLGFDFTMAFQPIVDCANQKIFGYEALVRGLNNESAFSIISQVNDCNRYQFDQLCRTKAIALAAQLEIRSMLSINFLPNAIYQPELCLRTTLEAARTHQLPIEQIMFEFTEGEKVQDHDHIRSIVDHYQAQGFTTAIDDFGSGHSGLNLLADFQTDVIKLDMGLIRDIDRHPARQAIVRHSIRMFDDLGIRTLAEGIETVEEYHFLRELGVDLMQGYYFAKPGFEALPEVDLASL